MAKKITILSICLVLFVWISAGVGLFYRTDGQPRYVQSIHGEIIQLFGSGIYANNSTFIATIARGTDLIMIFVAFGLLLTTLNRNKGVKTKLLHAGFLISLLYYATTTAFERVFNQLFLIYTGMFGLAVFAFAFTMIDLSSTIRFDNDEKTHRKTAVFTMLAGCSVLVWLMDIIPAIFTGVPPEFISIYTTSPTKILDIALIFPTCFVGGIWLMRKRSMGYILPPVMLTFLAVMAVTVIMQSSMQMFYDVYVPIHQLVGYVGTFVIFGAVAVIVNTRFMLSCWPKK